jgi:hypothetical protein
MYVLVRKDLSLNKRMTQGLCCLGNFVISSNITCIEEVIILEVESSLELLYYNELIGSKGITTYSFKDKDLNDQITSIVVESTEISKKILQRLKNTLS